MSDSLAGPRATAGPPSGRSSAQPDWYKDAIIYELRVPSFCDSNADGVGDLRGLISKLDYLKGLGVTALWLLPLYPSPLQDDGYDISDYFDVHAGVGTLDDFRELVAEAHARGLKLITELVLNHSSDQHPWFLRARQAPPGSSERNFYVWTHDPGQWQGTRVIFQDYETSNWTWDPIAKAYYWHRFFSHQPDLNYENEAVQNAMLSVVDFWFGLGVDGMRLDAVPYLYERANTSCENLPETHAFLRKLRAHVDRHFQGRMFLAEANQWPEDAVPYFGEGDECHMAFHFPIMPRLFMALRMEDSYPIADMLEQTPEIPSSCQWAIFLRNHDELTLEMLTDEERDYMVDRYAADRQARLNLGIRRRLAPLLENDRRRIQVMNLLLLSLPGTPVLYYGDEIGMGDNVYLGDRDGVRTPMQWSPDRNGGFSGASPQKLILPMIMDAEYSFDAVNVDVQEGNPNSLLWWMKRVLALRKRHAAFGRGSLRVLSPKNRKMLVFLRQFENETLLVVANLSRHPQWVDIDLSEFEGEVPIELVGNVAFPKIEQRPYRLSLGGHDGLWLRISSGIDGSGRPSLSSIRSAQSTLALSEPALLADFSLLEPSLSLYLPAQPPFRTRASSVAYVQLLTLMQLPELRARKEALFLAVVRVELVDGERETCALPLEIVEQEERPRHALVGLLQEGEAAPLRWLCDASASPQLARALQSFASQQRVVKRGDFTLRGHRNGDVVVLRDEKEPTVIERNSTCFVFGKQLVGKLSRRLELMGSLEVAVLKGLESGPAAANFPRLAAHIDLETAGEKATLWLSESFIDNEGDAWQLAIDGAQRFYELRLSEYRDEPPPSEGGDLFDEAAPRPSGVDFCELARIIGQRTAELHTALARSFASTPWAPKPVTALSRRAYYQSLRNLSAKAFDALERLAEPGVQAPLVQSLLARRALIHSLLDRALSLPLTGMRIRTHGDYHLGQLLYTGSDFHIIDFDGEPMRTPAERRRLRLPIADLASMLRSFHYAAYGVLYLELPGSQTRAEDRAALEPWAGAFYRSTARAFLGSYRAGVRGAEWFPEGTDDLRVRLDIHLLEKALYELIYELNHRPDWACLPLRALLELTEGADRAPRAGGLASPGRQRSESAPKPGK